MFEEMEVPLETMDWAKAIRAAIENRDWYGAGEVLGNKLNELIERANWDKWGKSLGEKPKAESNLPLDLCAPLNGKASGPVLLIFSTICSRT